MCWAEEYEIQNDALPELKITVAGNERAGIISFIERYGFYEGGDTNPYRIDPDVLVAVLTGKRTQWAFLSLERKLKSEICTRSDEQNKLLACLDSCNKVCHVCVLQSEKK